MKKKQTTTEFDNNFTHAEVEAICKKYDRDIKDFYYWMRGQTCWEENGVTIYACRDVRRFIAMSMRGQRDIMREVLRKEILEELKEKSMERKELIDEFKKDLRHETALVASDPARVIQLESIIAKLEKNPNNIPLTLAEASWANLLKKVWEE